MTEIFQNIEDYKKEYEKVVVTDFQEKKKRGRKESVGGVALRQNKKSA